MAAHPPKRYTVTAALLYANGPIHIGHLAGCYLPADTYVRYLRATGAEVLFVSGSDEHGVAITMKARQEGSTPQQVIDKYHTQIKSTFEALGISFDVYSRTSSKEFHHPTAQEFFRKFYDEGKFEAQESEQYYDETAGAFLADRYIRGTCPVCANPDAYGDQCERCGSSLSPNELKNPRSALSGAAPVLRSTRHWYLPLDRYQPWIQAYIDSHKDWKPNVYGQCQSWLKSGLHPRAMTRDLDWGIDVPQDIPGSAGKKLYVWFDAPIGYISAAKDWAAGNGYKHAHNILPKDKKDWERFWLRDKSKSDAEQDTRLIHFIGKDNIVFHCIIFPAMLHAHGDYVLADNVPANEFMNLEGDKISTSRNWAVWVHEYLEDFKQIPRSNDMLRYYLTATAPETSDSDFSWKDFQTRVNSELVAVYSNFVHRVLTLMHKFYAGQVPTAKGKRGWQWAYVQQLLNETERRDFFKALYDAKERTGQFKFREGLFACIELARWGNVFLQRSEPWKKVKTDAVEVALAMNFALELTGWLAVLTEPYLPDASAVLRRNLNISEDEWAELRTRFWADIQDERHLVDDGKLLIDLGGKTLAVPEMLFQNLPDELIVQQLDKLAANKAAQQAQAISTPTAAETVAIKPSIEYADFEKMDLRLGSIVAAEKVKGADKLLKLTVNLGNEQRTIVSGIALHYVPEAIVGQRVLVLCNLAPRKLRGIESQGMILMAEDGEGKLCFVGPTENFADGCSVK